MSLLIKGITKLSQLTIDAAKNWAGLKIENLGAPDSADDAKRHDSAPAAHKASHEDGDGDEISIAGLSGESADLGTHKADTTTAHGAVSAATASKHVVRDASARAKFAQSAAAGDAIVADANNRAPNSTLLEGSSKATVQDHTPKAHTLDSHSASRIGKDRMEWTLNKLLKGAGVGSDPTEIDVPAGNGGSTVIWKDVSERALTDTARTSSLNWTDLDLTAYTSASAKIVMLRLLFTSADSGTAGNSYLRVRKNGTTPDHHPIASIHNAQTNGIEVIVFYLVGLDGGEVIEYKIDVATNANVWSYIDVLGYIE